MKGRILSFLAIQTGSVQAMRMKVITGTVTLVAKLPMELFCIGLSKRPN